MPHGHISVAYTHLDVDKRQAGKERHYGNFMDEPRHYRYLIDHYDCHQHEGYHAPDPVSYTHLDVYKRQGKRSAAGHGVFLYAGAVPADHCRWHFHADADWAE